MKKKVLPAFIIFLPVIVLTAVIFTLKSGIRQSRTFPFGFSESSPSPVGKPAEYKTVDGYLKTRGYFETSHTVSPDGNFLAYFFIDSRETQELAVRVEGLLAESVVEFPEKEGNGPLSIFRKNLKDNNNFFEEELYRDFQNTSIYSYINSEAEKRIAWSNDGNMLAVLVPGKIVLAYFDHVSSETDIFNKDTGGEDKKNYRKILLFNKKLDIPLPFYTKDYAMGEKIFFSGDGKRIWIGFERPGKAKDSLFPVKLADKVYSVDLSTFEVKEKKIASINRGNNIYPVPGQPGIAYWTEGKEGVNKPGITLDFNSPENIYQLPEYPMDYPGKILLSPDLTKVCVEYGTSGFWGYLIYELADMRKLNSGGQYSYCVRWIGSDEIIIVDHPFFQQTYYYTYLLNTKTKEKILIDETGNDYIFNKER